MYRKTEMSKKRIYYSANTEILKELHFLKNIFFETLTKNCFNFFLNSS